MANTTTFIGLADVKEVISIAAVLLTCVLLAQKSKFVWKVMASTWSGFLGIIDVLGKLDW